MNFVLDYLLPLLLNSEMSTVFQREVKGRLKKRCLVCCLNFLFDIVYIAKRAQ